MVNLYCFFDHDVSLANPPFLASSDAEAKRLARDSFDSFSDEKKKLLGTRLVLRKVGNFDEFTGQVLSLGENIVYVDVCPVSDIIHVVDDLVQGG